MISHGGGDFGGGEIPLTSKERAEAKLIEVPGMLIAIVPIYNLPGLQGELRVSGELLAEIFLGHVNKWNSPYVAKLNPELSLPDLPIKVVHRTPGKGSSYIFTGFLSSSSTKFRAEIGTNPSPQWPVGTSAERSSDMADKVQSEPGSIGYVEEEYAVRSHLAYASVLNRAGNFVKASPNTMVAACQAVESRSGNPFTLSMIDAPGPDSFPITAFSWLYLPTAQADAARSAALVDFLNWAFTDGQELSSEDGYPSLPPSLLEKIRAKVGTLH
jgi:phosphate transport system substrate-binding protein